MGIVETKADWLYLFLWEIIFLTQLLFNIYIAWRVSKNGEQN